jgi:hypothetical protein
MRHHTSNLYEEEEEEEEDGIRNHGDEITRCVSVTPQFMPLSSSFTSSQNKILVLHIYISR